MLKYRPFPVKLKGAGTFFIFLLGAALSSLGVSSTGVLDPREFPLPSSVQRRRGAAEPNTEDFGDESFLQVSAGFSNPTNPYCRVCINIFNTLVAKPEFGAEKLCQQQPLNARRQCELIAASLKRSKTVAALLEGCTDTTGNFQPELQSDNKPVITESNGVRAAPCPGVASR